MPTLFDAVTLGSIRLHNRLAMAPMTRCRTTQTGDAPNASMARYYAERASAGLIVTEAAQISRQAQGYSCTPGIYSDAQIAGWRLVTDAVHDAGGTIFLQLWHVGRMSHASFHADGLPVAPSAIAPGARVWVVDSETGKGCMADCPTPRALETREVSMVVEDFRRAAANALKAGFDGVEIHGANGYLIDAFLRRSSNRRTDRYGGSQDNRVRFLAEVAQAVADVVGPDRTGVRLSPFITKRGMVDDEIFPTVVKAAEKLEQIGLAYIHLAEADWDDAPETPDCFRVKLRRAFSGRIIVAGAYDQRRAHSILWDGHADLVAFGRPFIANPDLPHRLQEGLPLEAFDPTKHFVGDEVVHSSYLSADVYAPA